MPGLHDAHLHTQMVAEFEANLSVDPEQSWEEIAAAIQARAATATSDWILGGNLPWLTEVIGARDDVPAHFSTLDRIAPDHAVSLWDVGGHAMLANSKALALAGITAETPDPAGGTIERDETGEPTGVLRELATNLILENAPPLPQSVYEEQMAKALTHLLSLGITSVQEAWAYPQTMRALKALDEAGELPTRVSAAIAHPEEFTTAPAKSAAVATLNAYQTFEGDRLKARYAKFVLDGSAGGQTLVLVEPYLGTDFYGHFRNDPEAVMSEVSRMHGLGVGSMLHAVGDGAVRLALDAVEQAIATHGEKGVRHIIAHTVFVNPQDLPRFSELGVIAEFSPYFWFPNEGQEILRSELGRKRLSWAFPARSLLDAGVPTAAGSDWPVVFDPNPFPAIETLVTREYPGGSEDHFGKPHAITLPEVLHTFTLGGAYLMHQENETGSLEPGKRADFIVLDQNLFESDVYNIHQTRVLRTVLDGEVVYQHGEDS